MATELVTIDTWLKTRLAANATLAALGIHADVVPSDASLPAVVFQFQGGTDLDTINNRRIWVDAVYIVKVVGQTASYSALDTYAGLIDTQLERQSGTAAGGTIYTATREAPFRLAEQTDGKQYRHIGGRYRIRAIGA